MHLSADTLSAMSRGWSTGSQQCEVNDERVLFDLVGYTPLDMEWGCPLERYLTDPDYAAHVRENFPDGTEAQVRAEVVATLQRLGRPVPEAAPPPWPPPLNVMPLPLPTGDTDECGLALATLIARIAHALDPTVPEEVSPAASWGPLDRVDNHAPLYRAARLGRVELIRELCEERAFSCFRAYALELIGDVVVSARWDGAQNLRVEVRAPSASEPAVRAVLGAPFLHFSGT